MKYKINEIFYSIQAEGYYSGYPAVFIRFSGCNLKCPWCDTKNHNEGKEYTKEELEQEVEKLTNGNTEIIIVFTGGEPTLQLSNEEELLEKYYKTIETNGILLDKIPSWINWITCSPKTDLHISKIPNEIKLVFEKNRVEYFKKLKMFHRLVRLYIQPLEENGKMNIKECMDFILKNPEFKLSLQIHKMIGVK